MVTASPKDTVKYSVTVQSCNTPSERANRETLVA
jgi:hypothetical protein